MVVGRKNFTTGAFVSQKTKGPGQVAQLIGELSSTAQRLWVRFLIGAQT